MYQGTSNRKPLTFYLFTFYLDLSHSLSQPLVPYYHPTANQISSNRIDDSEIYRKPVDALIGHMIYSWVLGFRNIFLKNYYYSTYFWTRALAILRHAAIIDTAVPDPPGGCKNSCMAARFNSCLRCITASRTRQIPSLPPKRHLYLVEVYNS